MSLPVISSRRTARHLLSIACVAVLCVPALAQKTTVPRWRIDPYTKNDPELLKKLGYVSYGPFEFGQRGRDQTTSEQIDKALHPSEILWVETAHFRIGLDLDPFAVPFESETGQKLRSELTRLNKVLRKVNPKTRTLDPWLRLHLIAMRMEDLYREFLELVGVDEAEFPREVSDVIIGQGRYLGYGPYLGMQNKYLILVTEKSGPYKSYMESFIGKSGFVGQRWHFIETGSLFYGVAIDLEEEDLRDDTNLHANLVFNVAHNLIDGFRHYSYDLPVWITEGLGHWFERRVTPHYATFSMNESALADKRPLSRWEDETRKLIAAGKGAPFSEMYTWRDYSQIKFRDHVLMWSRWDFLMSLGREKFAEFMFQVKGRIDPNTWATDQTDLVGATREALRTTYNLTPLTLDEKWKEWVAQNYVSKDK